MQLIDILKPLPIGTYCYLINTTYRNNPIFVVKVDEEHFVSSQSYDEDVDSMLILNTDFSNEYELIDTVQEAIFRNDMKALLDET